MIYFLKQKSMKYLLADDGVFSLKFGPSSFDWSLFTDTELDTSDPDLTLMTQNTQGENTDCDCGICTIIILYIAIINIY